MKVLVVDDEKIKRITLRDDLREANYDAIAVESPATGLQLLENEHFDVLVSDLRMPRMHGIDFLKRVKKEQPHVTVIIMTAYATVETAVEAMKFGAHNYIKKPFSSEELVAMLDKLKRLHQESGQAASGDIMLSSNNTGRLTPHQNIVGRSQQIQEVLVALDTVAESNSNVLIYGERGVGKALLAKSIHSNSRRRYQPYVRVNCSKQSSAALHDDMFGNEMIADGRQPGRLELSHGGTLFLADIENLPYEIQVKLLQVLEDGEFVNNECTDSTGLDVRMIAATTVNLREKVRIGEFREDLYYRLNVVPLFLPPLRERMEDISLLISHFVELFSPRRDTYLVPEAIDLLAAYTWPGNVSELENLIERLVTMGGGRPITVEDIPIELKVPTPVNIDDTLSGTSFREIVQSTERELIAWAMRKTKGNKTQSAKLLNMKPSTFRDALAKYIDEIGWEA
ncbi:MAG: sigma-54 dependent transcriptional regulator [Candidatus Poribacteria bacterium]|nr:sigma-54 dependent transcriptional regulator [Candidatus Poribacteria bacterium]MDE0506206.1 sigma-54 dependent transcriptional regulator [Candidatus Poribacteria bacterium]